MRIESFVPAGGIYCKKAALQQKMEKVAFSIKECYTLDKSL